MDSIAFTKAFILFGLFGLLFKPLQSLMNPMDILLSFVTALILCYGFYVLEKTGERT